MKRPPPRKTGVGNNRQHGWKNAAMRYFSLPPPATFSCRAKRYLRSTTIRLKFLNIKLTTDMELLSIRERASDIHIEPMEDRVRVRYRIDGALQEALVLDKPVLAPLVETQGACKSGHFRKKASPGRISFAAQNTAIDIRFSCIPTIYGEKVVLRQCLLPKKLPTVENFDIAWKFLPCEHIGGTFLTSSGWAKTILGFICWTQAGTACRLP